MYTQLYSLNNYMYIYIQCHKTIKSRVGLVIVRLLLRLWHISIIMVTLSRINK